MLDRLLETKFHMPLWRSDGVMRPRLLEQLQAGLIEQRKLTLVSAPAGYGKTTLITSWLHSFMESIRTIWLSLEERDNDPARFLSYWATAWSRISGLPLDNIQDLLDLPQLPPIQTILDEIINPLAGLEEPAILVLDDYHSITNALIHEIVEYFLEHQPHPVHLVIITRSDPPLPLARLRARAQLIEIRAGDLRFSEEEAGKFFNHSMRLTLEEEDIRSLELRTEGWVVGLQLAALALKNLPDPQNFVETFRGSHRFVLDYLAEEVIHQQRKGVRAFLIQTSILERFNAESCEALTGYPDSQELLNELEQANLFLIPLDDERVWYRYHHLFADFLQTELSRTEAAKLYKKAAHWHEQHAFLPEAVHYAIASSDLEILADIVDRGLRNDAIWSGGNLTMVATWLDALPPQAYQNRPALSLNASYILYLSGRFDFAENQIDQAEKTLLDLPFSPEKEHMLALAALYRGTIASVRGDTRQAIEKITFAQDRIPQGHHLPHARAFFSLGLAHEVSGKTDQAVRNYLKSSEEAQSAGVLFLAIHALGAAAQVQISQGQLQRAKQTCEQAIQIAGGKRLPPLGLVEIILGNIALEQNELAAAEEYLQKGIGLSRRGGLYDDVVVGLSQLSRLYVYQGHKSEAFEAAHEVNTILQGYGVARISMIAAAYAASLEHYIGQEAAAKRWAAEYQAIRAGQSHEFADLTLVRILLKAGERSLVPATLDALLQEGEGHGRIRTCIEAMTLMALFHRAENDTPSAVACLTKALRLAAPEGFLRIFLDEATDLLDLLPKARQAAPALVDAILSLQRAESSSQPSPTDQLLDILTERELEVLRLFAAGLSNQEIADRLIISLGTVKAHSSNIYRKLEVNNRAQSIVRAQELNLL